MPYLRPSHCALSGAITIGQDGRSIWSLISKHDGVSPEPKLTEPFQLVGEVFTNRDAPPPLPRGPLDAEPKARHSAVHGDSTATPRRLLGESRCPDSSSLSLEGSEGSRPQSPTTGSAVHGLGAPISPRPLVFLVQVDVQRPQARVQASHVQCPSPDGPGTAPPMRPLTEAAA